MRAILAALAALFLAVPAAPAAVLPATPATLGAVLKAAKDGDTIAPTGTFGVILVKAGKGLTFDMSAATASTLRFEGGERITVRGGVYRPVDNLGGVYVHQVQTASVSDVQVYGGGQWPGVVVRSSSDARVVGGWFDRPKAGIKLITAERVVVLGNAFWGAGADGIDLHDASFVTVEANVCAGNLVITGQHPDCVQMFGATHDVTIRNNLAHGDTQGFSAFGCDPACYNVTWDHNTVLSQRPQALGGSAVKNAVLRNNYIATLPGAPYQAKITAGGDDAIRCGNTVEPALGKKGVVEAPCR